MDKSAALVLDKSTFSLVADSSGPVWKKALVGNGLNDEIKAIIEKLESYKVINQGDEEHSAICPVCWLDPAEIERRTCRRARGRKTSTSPQSWISATAWQA